MELDAALFKGAEIVCANGKERNQVLAILDNSGIRECFKGIGAPDGMVISLFPDNSYMVDSEISSTTIVPSSDFINANLYVS